MITQNLLMFEIDETRYYYSARASFRMFFCTKAMFTLENVLDGKKTENLIGGGGRGGGGRGGGIRMSWVEKFRKTN